MDSEEVPSDLINQSQIGFRQDAGLSSFNPQHATQKSLPTVQHSISALDTQLSCLRCKRCKGKLLRGSHSLICIYCGQCQARDLPPEPIFFNSTTGYHWLLQSLNLNPLERVGDFFEENRRNKGGTPVEDGKTLAELLDVQIAWRDEPENPETRFVDKIFDQNSFLNFGKVGLDNFVTGSGRDSRSSDASEEQPVTSKNDRSDDFIGQGNLSLFQNDPVSSDLSGGASSGHDAEIHDVNSTTQNEEASRTAALSSDLSHNRLSGHNGETQPVNSRTRNEDSKPTAAIPSGLSHDGSSEHDAENQSLLSRPHNKDSKTAAVTSALSVDASSGHDTEIEPVNYRTQNDAKLAAASESSRDSSSRDDMEIRSANSRKHNEDTKTVTTIASNLNKGSLSEDDSEVQSNNSRMQNKDSKSVDTFVGSEVDLSARMDSGSRYVEDINNKKRNNNLDRVQDYDHIQDDPIHKD